MRVQKENTSLDIKKIFYYFIAWRVMLQIILLFSISVLPLQLNFLGGGLSNYLSTPHLWAFANFDGEHYLSIARNGYQSLTYFFFPVYPIIVKQISIFFGESLKAYLYSGLLVSNLSLIIGLMGLVKLIRIDYSERIAYITLVLILLFPTSFYFGAVYTESLFFALIVWSFYFGRKRNWLLAGLLGALATATRITGLALFPAILAEYFIYKKSFKTDKSDDISVIPKIALIPVGFLAYIYYLWKKVGDPLEFLHNITIFGSQRSSKFILLPQVFYRYFFKILPNVNYHYFPNVFTTYLEIVSSLVFGILCFLGLLFSFDWKKENKIPPSYIIYAVLAYLIPTLSGSFSSLPRYVLVLFPAFLISAIYLDRQSTVYLYLVYLILFIGLCISTSLFARGYWIS